MIEIDWEGDGISTDRAKRELRKSFKRAKKLGHDPRLISKLGYCELYGCMNVDCNATMDAWDSPPGVNGPMEHAKCRNPKLSTIQKLFRNIFSFFTTG